MWEKYISIKKGRKGIEKCGANINVNPRCAR